MKRVFILLMCFTLLIGCSEGQLVSSQTDTQESASTYTIGEIPIDSFMVVGNEKNSTAVKIAVYELCGKLPKKEAENAIRFDIDQNLLGFQVRVVFDGSDLVIYTLDGNVSEREIDNIIHKIFDTKLNEKTQFDITENVMPQEYGLITNEHLTQLRDETNKRIEEIKNTPNIEIPTGATVYYVSNSGNDANDGKSPEKAIKTIEHLNEINFNGGEYVLFQRGGFFRGEVIAHPNVTYSAYGDGEKPIITPSPENGADESKWTLVATNVWEYESEFEKDVGAIVFNGGEAHGVLWLPLPDENGNIREYLNGKRWTGYENLDEDLGYWYDSKSKKIFLCSKQNPGKRFESIEFGINKYSIKLTNGQNTLIDNISVKYAGHGGIAGANELKNFVVQNCEFHWIGGGIHFFDTSVKPTKPVRWGNGVGIFGKCDGFTVDNCYFSQIYDAAISPQYNFAENDPDDLFSYQKNMVFKNNVTEYCNYSIEYFIGKMKKLDNGIMENFLIENNLMWYAGEGFCEQRPDKNEGAHIKSWGHPNPAKNFVIKNNLMCYSKDMLMHVFAFKKEWLPLSENNVYVGEWEQSFGVYSSGNNTRVNYDTDTKDYFSEYSNGDKFYIIKE